MRDWKIKKRDDEAVEVSLITEGGGAKILCLSNGDIHLYEVPQYGGEIQFTQSCKTLNDAMLIAESWT